MKYLVKVNKDSNEVISYDVKYISTSKTLPRGEGFSFIESETVLKNPIVSQDEDGKNILIEDPVKVQEEIDTQYQRDRRNEYELHGLTFDSFIEMLIENDAAAMAAYRNKRDAIKVTFPKPIQGE